MNQKTRIALIFFGVAVIIATIVLIVVYYKPTPRQQQPPQDQPPPTLHDILNIVEEIIEETPFQPPAPPPPPPPPPPIVVTPPPPPPPPPPIVVAPPPPPPPPPPPIVVTPPPPPRYTVAQIRGPEGYRTISQSMIPALTNSTLRVGTYSQMLALAESGETWCSAMWYASDGFNNPDGNGVRLDAIGLPSNDGPGSTAHVSCQVVNPPGVLVMVTPSSQFWTQTRADLFVTTAGEITRAQIAAMLPSGYQVMQIKTI